MDNDEYPLCVNGYCMDIGKWQSNGLTVHKNLRLMLGKLQCLELWRLSFRSSY